MAIFTNLLIRDVSFLLVLLAGLFTLSRWRWTLGRGIAIVYFTYVYCFFISNFYSKLWPVITAAR